MNNDAKIRRTFMKDEAYQKLRLWIVSGEMAPGTKLRDQELSEKLGISRTPIREALLMLENDGLVETKANRWTIVSEIDLNKAEENYVIVWTLEGLAIRLGLPHFTDTDIEELELLNEQLQKLVDNGNNDSALEVDNAFHDKIIRMSKSEELRKLLINVKLKIQRIEAYYFAQKQFLHTSYEEHQIIIQAIRDCNEVRAEQALTANWKKSLDRLRERS